MMLEDHFFDPSLGMKQPPLLPFIVLVVKVLPSMQSQM
jgi:hypothetical protein